MKVILTQDIEKLGASHEVVEVADGYARNYLLPRSLALTATKSAMANLDNLKRVDERRQNRLRGAAQQEAAKLEGKTLEMDAKVGSEGRLYGSLNNADIAKAIKANFEVAVDRKDVLLADTIRTEGFYTVPVKLHRDVTVDLKVKVGNPEPEPEVTEAEAPAEAVA